MGGQYYALWPIFNIADSAIFVGVAIILVMQRRFFKDADEASKSDDSAKDSSKENNSTT
jgi:signal peptidase II